MATTLLVGRATKDFEIVKAGDKQVGRFSLAVDSAKKGADGKPTSVTFYNVETWDAKHQEQLAKDLKKGNTVIASGQLAIENFEREDGSRDKSVPSARKR